MPGISQTRWENRWHKSAFYSYASPDQRVSASSGWKRFWLLVFLQWVWFKARETLRVMLMVQRRKRTQFTGKFKEHLEKVEGIIQDAIDNLPSTDVESKLSIFLMH